MKKVIAFYLPQFHSIPENDEWWGKGFTEWVNVKKGKQYFEWQNQPRIPLDNNYYCLLDSNTQKWQADLAKKYNIYGFCYYHYWFDGHMLLEKPMENMLINKDIKQPFCICWANEDWTNAWVSSNAKVLISQTYGTKEDWVNHYRYLSKFFKDDRYILDENKPLFVIYRPEIIPNLNAMLECWQELARQDGFDGIAFAHQNVGLDFPNKKDDSAFMYDIEMQPIYAKTVLQLKSYGKVKMYLLRLLQAMHLQWIITNKNKAVGPRVYNYDEVWDAIINTPPIRSKSIPCAFVDFDNTSRRREQGWLFKGASPKKFKHYFEKLVKKSDKEYTNDYIFIFAWNEWAEGGYLEPDKKNGYGYLEAINEVLEKT